MGRTPAGRPKIIDPALADAEWAASTLSEHIPGTGPTAPNVNSELAVHRARRALAEAELAEIDLQKRRGELVPVAEVRAGVIEKLTVVRTKLLGLPSRVKQRMPHLSAADVVVIDDLVREALEELAADDG